MQKEFYSPEFQKGIKLILHANRLGGWRDAVVDKESFETEKRCYIWLSVHSLFSIRAPLGCRIVSVICPNNGRVVIGFVFEKSKLYV